MAVINQNPNPGSKVKINRSIHLTINARIPPKVRFPNLKNSSFESAVRILEANRLKLGNIIYDPNIGHNVILKHQINGKEINEGDFIDLGSKIDLVIGYVSDMEVVMPNLVGNNLEEAVVIIKGYRLDIGEIIKRSDTSEVIGRQNPKEGEKVKEGSIVDLWLE